MKNRFILSILFSVGWSLFLTGQTTTVSIADVTANPGEEIYVPIQVSNFNDVGAITLFIGYDPAVISYQGMVNIHPEVMGLLGNVMTNPDQIGLIWFASPPNYCDIGDGTLVELKFNYIGGSCDLTFNPGCEIVNSNLQTIPINYGDGSVSPNSQPATVTIAQATALAGEEILVPVDATGLLDVGAISFFIAFDQSILTFIGLENVHPDLAGIQSNALTNPSRVAVLWSADPPNFANPGSDKLFDLKFMYLGGSSDLAFTPDCEVTDSQLIPINISYIDGGVSQSTSTITATLANVVAAPGSEVLVGLDVTNFADVAAITFYVGYDPDVLTFLGTQNLYPGVGSLSANIMTNPDRIGLVWTADPPNYLTYSGKLLDLKFTYNGGNCTLNFGPGCEVSDNLLLPLPVTYFDGSVTQSDEFTIISIDTVFSDPGFEVLVPVRTEEFNDIGAMTMYIGYDPFITTFIGLENINPEIAGVYANTMTDPYRIAIAWTAFPPDYGNIPSGKLFDLKFMYQGGYGNLTFKPGCELVDSSLDIVLTSWLPGGVFSPAYMDVTAFLEGPFVGSELSNSMNNALPLCQCYNKIPWNYEGSENVPSIPDPDIVDWVLLELRETDGDASTATPDKIIATQAGFIFKDGTIVGHQTLTPIRFDVVITENLYLVVWHRNHLGVMSGAPLPESNGIYTWDFTAGVDKAYGGAAAQKEVAPGVWAMLAGDGNANGSIDMSDKLDTWTTNAGKAGYLEGDFNMDGQVNNPDKVSYWNSNYGKSCQVPQ